MTPPAAPMRNRQTATRAMAATLVALSLLCAGVGWSLRTLPLQMCHSQGGTTTCHSFGAPFAGVGTVTLVMAGVGLAVALLWLVTVGWRRREDTGG